MTAAKILIVDDDEKIRKVLGDRLRARGYGTIEAADGECAVTARRDESPDVVLLDLEMPRLSGMEVLDAFRAEGSATPVIVITAHGTIERAVDALKRGAFDFVTKPFEWPRVENAVRIALEKGRSDRALGWLRAEAAERAPAGPVAESEAMRRVVETARRAAAAGSTVLLLGESGTGKEVLARAIHAWSELGEGPFVAINCAALSEELLESELFGHERGAFTGALQQKRGKLELAEGGTAFLDEIGELKPALQAKLLRFLQEREFERVGGTRPVRVHLRVIAATNRDLKAAVARGEFREDLFYRLNVIAIRIPPLRERRADVIPLAELFLGRFAREMKARVRGIAPQAREAILRHPWPGNVRELENTIERAIALGAEGEVGLEDLPEEVRERGAVAAAGAGAAAAADGLRPYHEAVVAAKRALVETAIARAGGNKTKAAHLLGLQPTYFFRLVRNLGVGEQPPSPSSGPG